MQNARTAAVVAIASQQSGSARMGQDLDVLDGFGARPSFEQHFEHYRLRRANVAIATALQSDLGAKSLVISTRALARMLSISASASDPASAPFSPSLQSVSSEARSCRKDVGTRRSTGRQRRRSVGQDRIQ